MTTLLYRTFQKRVNDAIESLVKMQITPWLFMASGYPFHIKKFDGTAIIYDGVKFEGSPRTVFWSRYIEPFLEHLCDTEIKVAVSMAKVNSVDVRLLLDELVS